MQAEAPPAGSFKQGVFVTGRLSDFELTGERGTKCPNLRCAGSCKPWKQDVVEGQLLALAVHWPAVLRLCKPRCDEPPAMRCTSPCCLLCSIGQADVTANVYVRFDFVYDK